MKEEITTIGADRLYMLTSTNEKLVRENAILRKHLKEGRARFNKLLAAHDARYWELTDTRRQMRDWLCRESNDKHE